MSLPVCMSLRTRHSKSLKGKKTKQKLDNKLIYDNRCLLSDIKPLSFSLCSLPFTNLTVLSDVWPRDKGMIDLFCSTDRQSTFSLFKFNYTEQEKKDGRIWDRADETGRKRCYLDVEMEIRE